MLEEARMHADEVVPLTPIARQGSLPKHLVDECASDAWVILQCLVESQSDNPYMRL
jgi:hypothetical protein